MESYREEIKQEAEKANGYSLYGKNGEKALAFYEGYISGVNSKISERIKIEFAIECLEEIDKENDLWEMLSKLQNKITELKNKRDGK